MLVSISLLYTMASQELLPSQGLHADPTLSHVGWPQQLSLTMEEDSQPLFSCVCPSWLPGWHYEVCLHRRKPRPTHLSKIPFVSCFLEAEYYSGISFLQVGSTAGCLPWWHPSLSSNLELSSTFNFSCFSTSLGSTVKFPSRCSFLLQTIHFLFLFAQLALLPYRPSQEWLQVIIWQRQHVAVLIYSPRKLIYCFSILLQEKF